MSAKGARRLPGFYWVRFRTGRVRLVAEFKAGLWLTPGDPIHWWDANIVVLSDRLTPPKPAPRSAGKKGGEVDDATGE